MIKRGREGDCSPPLQHRAPRQVLTHTDMKGTVTDFTWVVQGMNECLQLRNRGRKSAKSKPYPELEMVFKDPYVKSASSS